MPVGYPTTQFFTGRMPFLPPNQQRQSTEGITMCSNGRKKRAATQTEKKKQNLLTLLD